MTQEELESVKRLFEDLASRVRLIRYDVKRNQGHAAVKRDLTTLVKKLNTISRDIGKEIALAEQIRANFDYCTNTSVVDGVVY